MSHTDRVRDRDVKIIEVKNTRKIERLTSVLVVVYCSSLYSSTEGGVSRVGGV